MVTQPSKKFWASFFLFFKCFRICWSFDFRSVFSQTHSLILGMLCVVWDWKKRGDDRIHWSVNPLISTSDDVKQWIPTGSDRLLHPTHPHLIIISFFHIYSHDFLPCFFWFFLMNVEGFFVKLIKGKMFLLFLWVLAIEFGRGKWWISWSNG